MIPVACSDEGMDSFLLVDWRVDALRDRRVCAIHYFISIILRGGRDKCNSKRGPLIFGEWSSSVKSDNMERVSIGHNYGIG